ncbi:MAG: methionine--tRNA ligase [Holosporales bacterium]|jgi:methionyl-tRNA synthetase|nr:methionine--tRNA ligase [Holosporales bacterium]
MTKRYLVTSALPYINGIKHLGNLIGSILPADVYARFLRQCGKEVLHICGTDEHGTPAEIAAQEANLPVPQYCEEMHKTQKEIYEKFDISFDFFGRTSSRSNHILTTQIFKELYKNGYISEQEISQYYSEADKRFLPDRYVEGTCPHCGYQKARGDQCDGCSALLNPEDLKDPYSAISGSHDVELRRVKHFFLDMPKLEPLVTKWIEQQKEWSDVVRGVARKWISEGLQQRCITRNLKWGIKVPNDLPALHAISQIDPSNEEDAEDKVFYVWFDAPNGYISITQDWAINSGDQEAWKKWWQPDNENDVFYVEFMAKDNVPFHTVFWPSILFGLDTDFKKVDDIKGFHWLTYEHGKFSTSQQRGVFTDTALELYPADYWRYFLLANCPEGADSDFSFALFASVVNKDLADILGNFASRVVALQKKYFGLVVQSELTDATIDRELEAKATKIAQNIACLLSERKFRAATTGLRSLWVLGNEYITQKSPWFVLPEDLEQGGVILTHCLHLLRTFAVANLPFIPSTARKIVQLLNDEESAVSSTKIDESVNFKYFKKGHAVREVGILFEKIDEKTVQALTARFNGGSNT